MKRQTLTGAQAAHFIIRKMIGTITWDERVQLQQWINESPANKTLYEEFMDPISLQREIAFMSEGDRKENWKKISEQLIADRQSRVIRLEEKGSAAVALKNFLTETSRIFTVIDKPDGIYEFAIMVNDDLDILRLGAAHGEILKTHYPSAKKENSI